MLDVDIHCVRLRECTIVQCTMKQLTSANLPGSAFLGKCSFFEVGLNVRLKMETFSTRPLFCAVLNGRGLMAYLGEVLENLSRLNMIAISLADAE